MEKHVHLLTVKFSFHFFPIHIMMMPFSFVLSRGIFKSDELSMTCRSKCFFEEMPPPDHLCGTLSNTNPQARLLTIHHPEYSLCFLLKNELFPADKMLFLIPRLLTN